MSRPRLLEKQASRSGLRQGAGQAGLLKAKARRGTTGAQAHSWEACQKTGERGSEAEQPHLRANIRSADDHACKNEEGPRKDQIRRRGFPAPAKNARNRASGGRLTRNSGVGLALLKSVVTGWPGAQFRTRSASGRVGKRAQNPVAAKPSRGFDLIRTIPDKSPDCRLNRLVTAWNEWRPPHRRDIPGVCVARRRRARALPSASSVVCRSRRLGARRLGACRVRSYPGGTPQGPARRTAAGRNQAPWLEASWAKVP